LEDTVAVEKRLGKLERSVMEKLWLADEPRTVGQVHHALAPPRELAYNTVSTVLHRLADKGLAAQDRVGRAHRYRAVVSREELIATAMIDALHQVPDLPCRAAALAQLVECIGAAESSAMRRALTERDTKNTRIKP
jgi:predicted transcriptional regulator